MATSKEQHDACPNARNIGRLYARALPADATPLGGVRAVTRRDLERDAAPVGAEPLREPSERT